jgi:hypothetical protein
MNLTGKCKEEFEKWFKDKYLKLDSSFCNRFLNKRIFTPNVMRYGLYLDFFDSVGITIDISPSNFCSVFYVYLNKKTVPVTTCGTREDARTASIEKANEIYNKLSMATDE